MLSIYQIDWAFCSGLGDLVNKGDSHMGGKLIVISSLEGVMALLSGGGWYIKKAKNLRWKKSFASQVFLNF